MPKKHSTNTNKKTALKEYPQTKRASSSYKEAIQLARMEKMKKHLKNTHKAGSGG